MIERLKQYFEEYKCLYTKGLQNLSFADREAYFGIVRKIIEGLYKSKFQNGTSITRYLDKKDANLKHAWSWVNTENHFLDSIDPLDVFDIEMHNRYFGKLFRFFNTNYETLPFSEYENLINDNDWIDSSIEKEAFRALIVARKGDWYTVAYLDTGYKQKNMHFIYSNQYLSVGMHYKIWTKKQKINMSDININISREILYMFEPIITRTKHIKDKEFIKLVNSIFKTYKISAIDYFKFQGSECKNNLYRKSIKRLTRTWGHEDLWQILLLKYYNEDILIKNMNNSPIMYEFWTKSPRGKSLTFREKEIITDFLISKKNFKNMILFKENEKFYLQLKTMKQYVRDVPANYKIDEHFPRNSQFSNQYQEKKIIERFFATDNKHITTGEINELLNCFGIIFKKNQIYEWKFDERDFSLDLDKTQILAVKTALTKSLSIIIGPAGHGKTRVASSIIKSFIQKNEKYIFLAPTHKARMVIEEIDVDSKISFENNTIQKILENPNIIEDIDNIIIDEISMVDDNQWIKLIHIIKNKKRIILVGDHKQLEPIYSTGIFSYLKLESLNNVVALSNNFRQVKANDQKEVNNLRTFGRLNNPENYVIKYSDYFNFIRIINKYKNADFQIITPINYGYFGTYTINQLFGDTYDDINAGSRLILADNIPGSNGTLYRGLHLFVESKIENIVTFSNQFSQNKIFNLEQEGFCFRNGKLQYKMSGYENSPFLGSTAITIHSSQGGTYDKVILVLPYKYKIEGSALYTAATRFKKEFKILAHENFNLNDLKK